MVHHERNEDDDSEQRRKHPRTGRIQRNRRANSSFVNPRTLQRLADNYPVPSNGEYERHLRVLEDMRRNRIDGMLRHAQAYEQRDFPPPSDVHYRTSVRRYFDDHLERAQALDRPQRSVPYTKEEVSPENVHLVDTLQLLRCRARTLCALVKRMTECNSNAKPAPFEFNSPEREGDDVARREHLLRGYIARKVEEMEVQRNVMERDSALKHRFNRSNRSGGPRHREWMRTNHAVVRELERRDRNDPGREFRVPQCPSVPPYNYSAQAHASNSCGDARMYPAQYATDVTRIERRMEAEEMGLRQPTRKDKLIAATVNAQNRGDLTSARRIQNHLDSIRAREREVARKKRIRKRQIRNCRDEMDRPGYNPDPNSDDEGGAPAA